MNFTLFIMIFSLKYIVYKSILTTGKIGMTLNEFRAWLDGFSYGINGAPTREQWEIIQEKLKETSYSYLFQGQPVLRGQPAVNKDNIYSI